MNKEIDLQSAFSAALDQYDYEKKSSSNLEQARSKQQMSKYIDSLEYSLRRLETLQEVVNEAVERERNKLLRQENIQTYKTKIINLSRELDMSYQEVIDIMADLEASK